MAVQYEDEAVVKLLLATDGVNPDTPDSGGRTPLVWAVRSGIQTVVKLLLSTKGVNPESEDSDGRTPLYWATEYRHAAVVKLLQNALFQRNGASAYLGPVANLNITYRT